MILFGVMCLIEDQQVDILHPDVGIQKAVVQDIGGTDYNHALTQRFLPYFFTPEI